LLSATNEALRKRVRREDTKNTRAFSDLSSCSLFLRGGFSLYPGRRHATWRLSVGQTGRFDWVSSKESSQSGQFALPIRCAFHSFSASERDMKATPKRRGELYSVRETGRLKSAPPFHCTWASSRKK